MMHLINHPDMIALKKRDNGKGFWMTFRNDWGISVQWDCGNYCDGKMLENGGTGVDAEIAVVKPNDWLLNKGFDDDARGIGYWGDDVIGYLKDYEVLKAMEIVSMFSKDWSDGEAIDFFVEKFYDKKEVTA
jgi:hypothetical protein